MALINCPECGTEISDKAKSCPNCGYPINTDIEDKGSDAGLVNESASKKPPLVKILIICVAVLACIAAVILVIKHGVLKPKTVFEDPILGRWEAETATMDGLATYNLNTASTASGYDLSVSLYFTDSGFSGTLGDSYESGSWSLISEDDSKYTYRISGSHIDYTAIISKSNLSEMELSEEKLGRLSWGMKKR